MIRCARGEFEWTPKSRTMRTLAMVVAASVLEFASAYAGLGSMGSISLRTACSSAAACAPSRAGLVAAGMTGGSSSRSQNRRLSAMRMCEGDENAAHRRRGTRRHITAFSSRAFAFRRYSHPPPCGTKQELRHALSLDPFSFLVTPGCCHLAILTSYYRRTCVRRQPRSRRSARVLPRRVSLVTWIRQRQR